MGRQVGRVCLVVLVIVISSSFPRAGAQGAADGASPSAASAASPVEPEQRAGAASGSPARAVSTPEREALDRIGREDSTRLRELEALARQAKGLELVEIQKRIGALKQEQERRSLDARIEAARQAGDARRLQQLLAVSVGPTTARPLAKSVEQRPLPAQEKKGGAR